MRMCVTGLLCGMCMISAAQVKWDGEAGDGQWNSPANWTNNSIPLPSDIVILDNSFVTATYSITLPPGNISSQVLSLSITPGAAYSISLVLPSTNTADPGLLVSGPGDALVINSRGVLRNSSGASTGTGIVISNTFRINDLGRYVHNTSRGNASIVSQLSVSPGTEHGEFEYNTPTGSATISLSNRHYGTLILSSTVNGGTATYIGSGASPANVRGHLKINSGVTFSINMSAAMIIHDSLVQQPSSIFNIQSSSNNNVVQVKGHIDAHGILTESGTGLPRIEMNGSLNQVLQVNGWSIMNNVEMTINNPLGVTLLSNLNISFKLHLLLGKMFNGSYELTVMDNAIVYGASTTSFIIGTVRKTGDETFQFPVGDGNIYAPITLENAGGETVADEYVVRYDRSSPLSISAPNFQSPIHHISYVEYWTVEKVNGGASKRIILYVGANSFALDPSTLLVANWDGVQWVNNGATSFNAGPVINGYVTGDLVSNVMTEPGMFVTMATSGSNINNPLPLRFVSAGIATHDDRILLEWKVANDVHSEGRFNVQYSGNGSAYHTIDSIIYDGARYSYLHRPASGNNHYYRIEYVDITGYRIISPILHNHGERRNIGVYPNPASSCAFVRVHSSEARSVTVSMVDGSYRELYRRKYQLGAGWNDLKIDLSGYSAGIYHIRVEGYLFTLPVLIMR